MKTVKRVIVAAMLVSADHKVLLGKQRQGGVYPECWHLPGGGVEDDETKEMALDREILEEVGIDISDDPKKLLSDKDTGAAEKTDKITGQLYLVEMQFHTYRIDLIHNAAAVSVVLGDDLVEYQWVDLVDLKNFNHTPPSMKLFKQLGYL